MLRRRLNLDSLERARKRSSRLNFAYSCIHTSWICVLEFYIALLLTVTLAEVTY
jgi:hypothetical protein